MNKKRSNKKVSFKPNNQVYIYYFILNENKFIEYLKYLNKNSIHIV